MQRVFFTSTAAGDVGIYLASDDLEFGFPALRHGHKAILVSDDRDVFWNPDRSAGGFDRTHVYPAADRIPQRQYTPVFPHDG